MGAFLIRLLIEDAIGVEAAGAVVDAWAGDRYVLFDDGDQRCITVRVELDDAAATTGLADALALAAYEPVIDDAGRGLGWSSCVPAT